MSSAGLLGFRGLNDIVRPPASITWTGPNGCSAVGPCWECKVLGSARVSCPSLPDTLHPPTHDLTPAAALPLRGGAGLLVF